MLDFVWMLIAFLFGMIAGIYIAGVKVLSYLRKGDTAALYKLFGVKRTESQK